MSKVKKMNQNYKRRFFDYASTSPTDPRVIEAMQPWFFDQYANPSSPHTPGREASQAVEQSRETLAKLLNVKPSEIIFTSSGTEANNHALLGVARALKSKGNHIAVCALEHSSVLKPLAYLEAEGFQIQKVRVNRQGLLDREHLLSVLNSQTIMVVVLHASNEIGTIQDLAPIGELAQERGIHFHVDAVQTVGHIPVDVQRLNCHSLSLSAHKFCGPKGVGALFLRKGSRVVHYMLGGDQESGRRASTHNVPGIVGLGKAVELSQELMTEEAKMQIQLRDRILKAIPASIDGVIVNGDLTQRLPNNAHFSFEGVSSESLLMSLDMVGVAASMGSACTSGAMKPSHVLLAIGLNEAQAFGSLRLSIGRWTTGDDVDFLLTELPPMIRRLRAI